VIKKVSVIMGNNLYNFAISSSPKRETHSVHTHSLGAWQHDHTFGQEIAKPGERRTLIVIAITAVTMVIELMAGVAFGSMALLADGLHMGSHTLALGITVIAYVYARRHARDARFSFGTGKVNALGGFTGAVLLALFALLMAWESLVRFYHPVAISFDQAIAVAVFGLIVNAVSAVILNHQHHDHDHDHHHHHSHAHAHAHDADHNLRSAYLHVIADALTSLLAIFALLAGKFFGFNWMDPLMGMLGALLVARWAWGLMRDTSGILLDAQAPVVLREKVVSAIEKESDNRVADLHVWSIGPGIYAASLAVVSDSPMPPEHYKSLIPNHVGLVHTIVEVHRCRH
jgi:cation diffusion facilitator family transporter